MRCIGSACGNALLASRIFPLKSKTTPILSARPMKIISVLMAACLPASKLELLCEKAAAYAAAFFRSFRSGISAQAGFVIKQDDDLQPAGASIDAHAGYLASAHHFAVRHRGTDIA